MQLRPRARGGRLDVAVGMYPWAWVAEQVGGGEVVVSDLAGPGVEPHDLELSPRQTARVGSSDLVLHAAGFQPALDEAVEQQAPDAGLDVLQAVELRPDGDPHVWLDPVRLATIAGAVAERLAEAAPEQAEGFRARAQVLTAELRALDDELRAGLSGCQRKELVTGHDAFGYLADAYGLEQLPIAGLSPEDEASPKRLAELALLARERGVTTVFFEELASPAVAESLASEVGATATVLSTLETAPEEGDYLGAMRDNLATLQQALGCG